MSRTRLAKTLITSTLLGGAMLIAMASNSGAQTPATSVTSGAAVGDWRVIGQVGSFGFTLICRFSAQGGAAFGGECQDAATNDPKVKAGRIHPLSFGQRSGDHVRWRYPSSFLFTKFDVAYDGVQSGDKIKGTITVQGHKGAFTATRP